MLFVDLDGLSRSANEKVGLDAPHRVIHYDVEVLAADAEYNRQGWHDAAGHYYRLLRVQVRGAQPDRRVRRAAQAVEVDEQHPGLGVGDDGRVEGVALRLRVQAHLQQPAPAALVPVEQRGRGR